MSKAPTHPIRTLYHLKDTHDLNSKKKKRQIMFICLLQMLFVSYVFVVMICDYGCDQQPNVVYLIVANLCDLRSVVGCRNI